MDHKTRTAAYRRHINNKTKRFGRFLAELDSSCPRPEIIPTPLTSGFRARAKFKLYSRPDGLALMGTDPVHGESSAAEMMWLIPDWLSDQIYSAYTILSENYTDFPVDGFEVKCTHGDKKFHISLAVNRATGNSFKLPAQRLLSALPYLVGVAVPSVGEEYGNCFLEHKVAHISIYAHYRAFFQANLTLLPDLLEFTAAGLKHVAASRIMDLYCGVGLFSFFQGRRAVEITGVDFNRHAITSAQKNAARLKFIQAGFTCRPVEQYIKTAAIKPADLVFINPDRSGCSPEVITATAAYSPETICLVSCDPASFIRDLELWLRSGYAVSSAKAFDMFPFTDFLETVFILQRQ